MRVAAVQYDIAWEDKPANHAAIERLLDEADIAEGTFILLPELGDTGFSFNLEAIVDERSLAFGRHLARQYASWVQVGHAERGPDQRGRNCATILAPGGETMGRYEKVHPFSFGREMEHFTGGNHLLLIRAGGAGGALVAPMICYDLRFPELWRHAALAGGEVFTIGASWPIARQSHWRALAIARAIENQAYVAAVNRTGRDPHLEYAGGSIIVSPKGEILAEAGDEPCVLRAELDLPGLRAWRETFPALRDLHTSLLGRIEVVKRV